MERDNSVSNTIKYLDNLSSNYGFSQEGFGEGEGFANDFGFSQEFGLADLQRMAPHHKEKMAAIIREHKQNRGRGQGQKTSISANSAISTRTAGKSTFMVTVTVKVTGTGSGNVSDPIFLFGGESFNNSKTPYIQVQNAGQIVTQVVAAGKNAIVFTYGDGTNNTAYTVSMGTAGEYPFILNSLVGTNKMKINGIQSEISDAAQQSQLSSEVSTFFFNEFGKASTDDLTTPKDLYQQQSNGVFMPHEFEISGKRGMLTTCLNIDGFVVKYYFYATPFKG